VADALRVLIADDHPLFRMGLRYALAAQGFEVVAEAADGKEALELCRLHRPQAVLMDVKMPNLDGIEACKRLKAAFPEVLVVMLTTFEEPAIVQAAKVAGATGYLSKETDPHELARALRGIVERPERNWLPRVELPEFTPREKQVLALLVAGGSTKQIAKALDLSPETVKDYLASIYRKLGVRDRLAAVREARELGLG
jgi:two-component system nitrate/nitrite response regulator NarL